MARKRSNLNLPGALHYVTGNFLNRAPVFTDPGKLITYVLMPDHIHLIANLPHL